MTLPRASGPAPILPVDRRPTDGELDELDKALPAQPLHLALAVAGDRERAGWWGGGRPASWADAVDAVREVAAALGVEVTVRAAAYAPWHPGRCAESPSAARSSAMPVSCTPRSARPYGVPARTAVAEIDLDAAARARRPIVPAPSFSDYPVAKEDVALVVDESVTAAEVEAALREGAGECWSRSGSSTSTPATRWARARSRWPSRCASGRPTGR